MTDIRAKQDRRTQLITAARIILAEKGFEATTVAEIVARAGVAQGTFYLYFSSKFALIQALNQEMNKRILVAIHEIADQEHSAAEIVRLGIAAAFRELERYRDVLNVIHVRTSSDQAVVTWEQLYGAYHHLIAELIRQFQGTGEIDNNVRPEIYAKLIVGMIHHAADECYLYNPGTGPEIYVTEMTRFVSRALGINI